MTKAPIIVVSCVLVLAAAPLWGQQSGDFGWEDGTTTALGSYGNAVLSNSGEQAYGGTRSLKFVEDPIGGTPQAYIWWVTGLTDADDVTASFWVYDETPSSSPSGRIWGHYTSDPGDIESYAGSAGGNSTYSDGTGWSELSWTWPFDSDGGTRDGFVVEARIYSGDLTTNTIYVDSTQITVTSDTATVYAADGSIVPVELQSFTVE